MIIDCPACGAGLMFDPESGKMKCEACGSLFETYELENAFQARGEKELRKIISQIGNTSNTSLTQSNIGLTDNYDVIKLHDSTEAIVLNSDFATNTYDSNIDSTPPETAIDDDMIKCNIYTCTSCGAEVSINDVEASTFCSFCGQPTVVFNRISYQRKPEYIIPFSVTKERAIELIRERLEKGIYVPKSIRNFEIEHVRGIYIPFWLYDIHYYDDQYLKGIVEESRIYYIRHFHREAKCSFSMLPLDASIQLNDELSQRLEPYDTEYLTDFSLGYLSGFYSDCYDLKDSQLDDLAIKRAKELFDDAVKNTINADHISLIKSNPDYNITNTHYAMFPAWFLTFRYKNIPYTLVVNGQTEKVIGGIPYESSKVSSDFAISAAVITVIAAFISYILINNSGDSSIKLLLIILFLSGSALFAGIRNMRNIKKSTKLTGLSETNHYANDRIGG